MPDETDAQFLREVAKSIFFDHPLIFARMEIIAVKLERLENADHQDAKEN